MDLVIEESQNGGNSDTIVASKSSCRDLKIVEDHWERPSLYLEENTVSEAFIAASLQL